MNSKTLLGGLIAATTSSDPDGARGVHGGREVEAALEGGAR